MKHHKYTTKNTQKPQNTTKHRKKTQARDAKSVAEAIKKLDNMVRSSLCN
jgi:hypothetical protein